MQKFKKKVSVIIRGKNESRWLRILLKEIKRQSENNYEIIFCDNNSTDVTKDILKSYKIKKIVNIKNYKPGLALNKGVSVSVGEYVVFLSAHCIPADKNWLKNFVDYMDKNKSLSAAYGKQIPLPGSNSQNTLDLNILFRDEEIIHTHDPYINNANSIYRSYLLKKNKFNQSISNIEDRVWAKDEVLRGGKIGYLANAAVFHLHGVHQHSVSTNRSIKTNLIINKNISKIWDNCIFIKPNYFSYSIIVNARREKKIVSLEKKIQNLKNFFLKNKCKVLRVYLITDLNIRKIKSVYKVKPNSIPVKDLNFIYTKYRNNWIETNYLVSLNSSIYWNYKKIFNLIKNTVYLSKPSGIFYEEYDGNFIIDFPDNSNFKSISLIQKKDKPKIKLMKWSDGCIFDPDYLRRGTYIDDETLMNTF